MNAEIENIIKKYNLRTISEQEKITLQEWLLSSNDNKTLFEELLLSYKQMIAAEYIKSIKKSRSRNLLYTVLSATAMIAGVVLVFSFMMTSKSSKEKTLLSKLQYEKPLKGIIISTNGEVNSLNTIINNDTILRGVAIYNKCLDYSKVSKTDGSRTKKEESVPTSIYVPDGEKFKIILSDGTVLWINADTKVDYMSRYSDSERRIKVDGEVFLDVAHNPQKPFIVEAANSEIKVLGTKFNVRSYSSDNNITTTLIDGSVSFNNQNVLCPNEQLQFNKTTKKTRITNVDASLFSSWIDGNYYFNEISTVELVELFKRVYNINISIKSDRSKDKIFTGSIYSTIEAKDMFKLIMKTTKIEYEIEKEEIIIW